MGVWSVSYFGELWPTFPGAKILHNTIQYYSYLVYASYMQKLSTGVLQSSMYNLKPLKHINTNARLSIKIEFNQNVGQCPT